MIKMQANNLQPINLMTDCIFCDIIAKKAPANVLYEDQDCLVIKTIQPFAPVHFLVIPRKHIESLNELDESDALLLSHLLLTARKVAENLGVAEKGYRIVINTGRGGGQTVFHLHVHLLSGATMDESLMVKGLV